MAIHWWDPDDPEQGSPYWANPPAWGPTSTTPAKPTTRAAGVPGPGSTAFQHARGTQPPNLAGYEAYKSGLETIDVIKRYHGEPAAEPIRPVSEETWGRYPSHLRARFMDRLPGGTPAMGYLQRGSEIPWSMRAVTHASFLAAVPGGTLTTFEPGKLMKRVQTLGAHETVGLRGAGLEEVTAPMRAGRESAMADTMLRMRLGLVVGRPQAGGAGLADPFAGQMLVNLPGAYAYRDYYKTLKPEQITLPSLEEARGMVGQRFPAGERVSLVPGHLGKRDPWWHTRVTGVEEYEGGLRFGLEQYIPFRQSSFAAKFGATKTLMTSMGAVGGIREVGGGPLHLQAVAGMKDVQGAAYASLMMESPEELSQLFGKSVEELRGMSYQELGRLPIQQFAGPLAEKWLTQARFPQRIHGANLWEDWERGRPQKMMGHWQELLGGREPTRVGGTPFWEIEPEYTMLVPPRGVGVQVSKEYGPGRGRLGAPDLEQIAAINPALAETMVREGSWGARKFQNVMEAHLATRGIREAPRRTISAEDIGQPEMMRLLGVGERRARAQAGVGPEEPIAEGALTRGFMYALGKSRYGTRPIAWGGGLVTPSARTLRQLGAPTAQEGVEASAYLGSVTGLARAFAGGAGLETATGRVREQQAMLAGSEEIGKRMTTLTLPRRRMFGGVAHGTELLKPSQLYIQGMTGRRAMAALGFRQPTTPEMFAPGLEMLTKQQLGEISALAGEKLDPNVTWVSQALINARLGDLDADDLNAIITGEIIIRDGKLYDPQGNELASPKEIHAARERAVDKYAADVYADQPTRGSIKEGAAQLSEQARGTVLTEADIEREAVSFAEKQARIGRYYNPFERMEAHATTPAVKRLVGELKGLSHGPAQRPMDPAVGIQKLHEAFAMRSTGFAPSPPGAEKPYYRPEGALTGGARGYINLAARALSMEIGPGGQKFGSRGFAQLMAGQGGLETVRKAHAQFAKGERDIAGVAGKISVEDFLGGPVGKTLLGYEAMKIERDILELDPQASEEKILAGIGQRYERLIKHGEQAGEIEKRPGLTLTREQAALARGFGQEQEARIISRRRMSHGTTPEAVYEAGVASGRLFHDSMPLVVGGGVTPTRIAAGAGAPAGAPPKKPPTGTAGVAAAPEPGEPSGRPSWDRFLAQSDAEIAAQAAGGGVPRVPAGTSRGWGAGKPLSAADLPELRDVQFMLKEWTGGLREIVLGAKEFGTTQTYATTQLKKFSRFLTRAERAGVAGMPEEGMPLVQEMGRAAPAMQEMLAADLSTLRRMKWAGKMGGAGGDEPPSPFQQFMGGNTFAARLLRGDRQISGFELYYQMRMMGMFVAPPFEGAERFGEYQMMAGRAAAWTGVSPMAGGIPPGIRFANVRTDFGLGFGREAATAWGPFMEGVQGGGGGAGVLQTLLATVGPGAGVGMMASSLLARLFPAALGGIGAGPIGWGLGALVTGAGLVSAATAATDPAVQFEAALGDITAGRMPGTSLQHPLGALGLAFAPQPGVAQAAQVGAQAIQTGQFGAVPAEYRRAVMDERAQQLADAMGGLITTPEAIEYQLAFQATRRGQLGGITPTYITDRMPVPRAARAGGPWQEQEYYERQVLTGYEIPDFERDLIDFFGPDAKAMQQFEQVLTQMQGVQWGREGYKGVWDRFRAMPEGQRMTYYQDVMASQEWLIPLRQAQRMGGLRETAVQSADWWRLSQDVLLRGQYAQYAQLMAQGAMAGQPFDETMSLYGAPETYRPDDPLWMGGPPMGETTAQRAATLKGMQFISQGRLGLESQLQGLGAPMTPELNAAIGALDVRGQRATNLMLQRNPLMWSYMAERNIGGLLGDYGLTPMVHTTGQYQGISVWQTRQWDLAKEGQQLQMAGQFGGMGFTGQFPLREAALAEGRQYQLATTGLGWQYQQAQFGFQRAGLGLQQRGMELGWRQQEYGMQTQEQRSGRQFAWRMEDWSYAENTRQMQFGWQMEDYDEAIRFATGRQRMLLQRRKGRAVIGESMAGEHHEDQRERMEESRQWQVEDHEKQREWFGERKTLQEAQHKLAVDQFEAMEGYQTELHDLQVDHATFVHEQNVLQLDDAKKMAVESNILWQANQKLTENAAQHTAEWQRFWDLQLDEWMPDMLTQAGAFFNYIEGRLSDVTGYTPTSDTGTPPSEDLGDPSTWHPGAPGDRQQRNGIWYIYVAGRGWVREAGQGVPDDDEEEEAAYGGGGHQPDIAVNGGQVAHSKSTSTSLIQQSGSKAEHQRDNMITILAAIEEALTTGQGEVVIHVESPDALDGAEAGLNLADALWAN